MDAPAPADPFETLGLPARFDLDAAAVDRAYLARAAACHPDLAGGDPDKAAEAARRSALLNGAKAALLNPETRARALLDRLGGAPGSERDLPDGSLMEIMETRMAVEEAAAGGDQAELARWRNWAAEQRRDYIDRVGNMFAVLGDSPSPEALSAIRRKLNAWRYIERMAEQIGGDG